MSHPPGARVYRNRGSKGRLVRSSCQVNVQPLNPYKILLGGATFCEAPTPAVSASRGAVKSIYR
jgi:hypothetical protein